MFLASYGSSKELFVPHHLFNDDKLIFLKDNKDQFCHLCYLHYALKLYQVLKISWIG